MSRVIWEALFVELPTVEGMDKEMDGTSKRIGATRETTGGTSQPGQIVTEVSIIPFDREGIRFSFGNSIATIVIPEQAIGFKAITEIEFGFRRFVHQFLNALSATFPDQFPAQNTACCAIHHRYDINFVFLSPINVNNSSNSAVSTASGSGGVSGKLSACAFTHLETVR